MIFPTPRNIWNAYVLGIDRDDISKATAKLLSIPTLAIVLSRPLDTPYAFGVGKINGQLSLEYIRGMHTALLASIVMLLIAIVLSVLRGRETRNAPPVVRNNLESKGN